MTRYEDIDALNWSTLKHLRTSPLQYRHRLEHPEADKAAYWLGRALHTLVLEPDTWDEHFVTYVGGDRRGKAWEAFRQQCAGRTILKLGEEEQAIAMADAIRRHPIASRHLRDGLTEKVLTWTEPESGRACKGRMDSVNGHLVEIKTAADIQPQRFAAAAARFGYHCQLAWYADGLRHSGYEVHEDPAMIVVQTDAPHDVVVYTIGNDVLDQGRREYQRLLRLLGECEESGHWPGMAPDHEWDFALPAWAASFDEEPDRPLTMGGIALAL